MIKLDQALYTKFIDSAFGLPIAHEGLEYSPTVGTAYVELDTASNEISALGLNDKNDTTGLMQFTLRYPIGSTVAAKTMCDTIFTAYPIGLELTYGSQSLQVTGNHRAMTYVQSGWYTVVGRIDYTAILPR